MSEDSQPAERTGSERVVSLWRVAGGAPRAVARDLWRGVLDRRIPDEAAQLAFWFLLAFFPFLISVFGVFGLIIEEQVGLRSALLRLVSRVLPDPDTTALVRDVLRDIQENRGSSLGIGLVIALWAASNALHEIHRRIDRDLGGERPLWIRRLSAIPLTLAVSAPVVVAIVLFFYGEQLGEQIAAYLERASEIFLLLWTRLRTPLMILAVVLTFDVVYDGAPSVRKVGSRWLTPGAVLAVLLWLLVSLGLRLYVTSVPTLSNFYGSLGTVVALLFWFYGSALAVLVGLTLNWVLLRREGSLEAKVDAPD